MSFKESPPSRVSGASCGACPSFFVRSIVRGAPALKRPAFALWITLTTIVLSTCGPSCVAAGQCAATNGRDSGSRAALLLRPDRAADTRLVEAFGGLRPELLRMVAIPGGSFTMGNPFDSPSDAPALFVIFGLLFKKPLFVDQGPRHEVAVSEFDFGKYEVTVEQFVFFLNAASVDRSDKRYVFLHPNGTVCYSQDRWNCAPGAENRAVDTVTWHGATEFCKWLSKQTGDKYRLPTEAEWEWAAKGKEGRVYPWGVTIEELPGDEDGGRQLDADVRRRADWGQSPIAALLWPNRKRRPVGSFPNGATPEGVCDMVGGVWEWCEDWYSLRYETNQSLNPTGPSSGYAKVMRGGQENTGDYTETITRLAAPPAGDRGAWIYGFRLLREREGCDDKRAHAQRAHAQEIGPQQAPQAPEKRARKAVKVRTECQCRVRCRHFRRWAPHGRRR